MDVEFSDDSSDSDVEGNKEQVCEHYEIAQRNKIATKIITVLFIRVKSFIFYKKLMIVVNVCVKSCFIV